MRALRVVAVTFATVAVDVTVVFTAWLIAPNWARDPLTAATIGWLYVTYVYERSKECTDSGRRWPWQRGGE